MVCNISPSKDANTHTSNLGFLSKKYKKYARDTIVLKIRSDVKVTMVPKIVRVTLPSKDAFTHKIWTTYLKERRGYAPAPMPILETR